MKRLSFNNIVSKLVLIKSMGAKFMQEIDLWYFVTPALILTNTSQSSVSPTLLVFCDICVQEPKRTALLIRAFTYNYSIIAVSAAGLNNTRQRDFVKVKAKIINSYFKSNRNTTKPGKS